MSHKTGTILLEGDTFPCITFRPMSSGITGQRKLYRNSVNQTCSPNGIKPVHEERRLEDT